MRLEKFIKTLPDCFDNLEAPSFPKDRRLQHISEKKYAMTTENIGFLLNHAVTFMEPGEVYVEVGTYKGGSLSYAIDGNADKEFFAFDNFTWFTKPAPWWRPWSYPEPKRTLTKVLNHYSKRYKVVFQEGDFRDTLSKLNRTIGVYFYDGAHGFKDQVDGLNIVMDKMAEESLIVVDDTNPGYEGSEARAANEQWLHEHPEWTLLFDLQSPAPCHKGWWCGIQILGRYRKRK